MNEAEDIALRNAPAFANLAFDPNATRKLHLQAMGFCWSDELPHQNGIAELEGDYYRLVVFLLSYRAVQTRGEDKETLVKYAPVWKAFLQTCPHWPGFHESRRSRELLRPLELACDEALDELEMLLATRECKKTSED